MGDAGRNKIGVVVLNYNTANETIACISSIKNFTSVTYSIYIIDNASTDHSYQELCKEYADDETVEVILSEKNRGYSAGNNIGIKRAVCDGCGIVFIINSDVELLNDALTIMGTTLQQQDSYMMIGPSVLDNEGKESQIPRMKLTFRIFVLARHPFCNIPGMSKRANRLYPVPEDTIFSFDGSVSGCCFGMRADDMARIGFLDEHVFLYSEEDILAYKMSALGKKAVVDPNAHVWHKANVSTDKEGSAFVQFHRWSSVLYMLKVYAKIGMARQVFVALWNTLTWVILSIFSARYRCMLRDFWKKNWQIVAGKYL